MWESLVSIVLTKGMSKDEEEKRDQDRSLGVGTISAVVFMHVIVGKVGVRGHFNCHNWLE